jgi:hypothetical protein
VIFVTQGRGGCDERVTTELSDRTNQTMVLAITSHQSK